MIATFIIKADIDALALKENSTPDQVIETLTQHFTGESGRFGSECWLDDVQEDDSCMCNAQEPDGDMCLNCNKKISSWKLNEEKKI